MADVDHPKTHVEEQVKNGDVELPRKQPESPKHEGIDPLTESDTMYPAENVQAGAKKANAAEEKQAEKNLDDSVGTPENEVAREDLAAQNEQAAKEATPDSQLPDEDKTATPGKGQQADKAPEDGHSGTDASPAGDTPPADSPEKGGDTSASNKTTSKKS